MAKRWRSIIEIRSTFDFLSSRGARNERRGDPLVFRISSVIRGIASSSRELLLAMTGVLFNNRNRVAFVFVFSNVQNFILHFIFAFTHFNIFAAPLFV